MKVVLLRVGIDTGSGGIHGPLYADGGFDFVCMADRKGIDSRTYGGMRLRDGRAWAELFSVAKRRTAAGLSVHVDPEFETFTYGDPTRPKAGLRDLERGDVLAFYAGLKGCDFECAPALYLVGYFEIEAAGYANDFNDARRAELFAENFHVRHRKVFEEQRDELLLIKGGPGSRLLKRAVRISAIGADRDGRPLHVLSPEMRAIFGEFGGRNSI